MYARDVRDVAADRYAEKYEVVLAVITRYGEVCELPRIAGSELNEEGNIKKYPLLSSGSPALHYKLDVERITERILEEPELQAAWFDLALGKPIKLLEKKLVRRLAGPYERLRPSVYFRRGSRA